MNILSSSEFLSTNQPSVQKLLQNTQGYIIEEHGRDLVWNLFLRFKPEADANDLRSRLSKTAEWIVSAHQLIREVPSLVTAIGLSGPGRRQLRLPASDVDLKDGLHLRTSRISYHYVDGWNDPKWIAEDRCDAIIILASNNKEELNSARDGLASLLGPVADITLEEGFVDRGPKHAREPFGFADGISQPVFFAQPVEMKPYPTRYNPQAPLNTVLTNEVLPGTQEPGTEFGSYMAFVKCEQHVDNYNRAVEIVSRALNCDPDHAGALLIGRTKQGCPLTGCRPDNNDFNRSEDTDGLQWPFGSHACKMNERKDVGLPYGSAAFRPPRMVRRGVSYKDGDCVGLLFQSFQANLGQFEAHLWWAVQEDHPRNGSGLDPILGTGGDFVLPDGRKVKIPRLVTFRGGEYFYFPSIPSLRTLPSQPQ